MSGTLTLCTCVLVFILLIQIINGAQFFKITFLFAASATFHLQNSLHKYVCITAITKRSLRFNLGIGAIGSTPLIIYFYSIFCSTFRLLGCYIV